MRRSRRSQLLLLAAVGLAVAPVTFGLIRAVSTGDDFRYLWLAAASFAGAAAVIPLGRGATGLARVSLARAMGAVGVGSVCAAGAALLLGATAGPGVAIVSLAFGFCSGVSGVLANLARHAQSRLPSA